MSGTSLRAGVTLQSVDPPDRFEELVGLIDELGYDDLWLTDSSLHARNPYIYLTLASRLAPRIRLGTAVTNPCSRHPAIVAVNAATLESVAPGRTVLGIGAGDRPLRALGLRPARIDELREAIGVIRRLLVGERVTTEAAGFTFRDAHLRFGAPGEIPVYISASGPRTLELAGEIADGVILLCGLFSAGVRYALEHIDAGAERAGRPRPFISVFGYGAIDDDEEAALDAARSIAAWFPQTAPHYCELAGLDPGIQAEVRARYSGGEFQEAQAAASLLPDSYVQKMAFAGNRAHARAHIRALGELGVDSISVFPLGPRREHTIREFAACIQEAHQPANEKR
jgi:5,10-methylenetetrahydromethanopterin reductase